MNKLTPEDALKHYGSQAWSEYSVGNIQIQGLPVAKQLRKRFIGSQCPKCGVIMTVEVTDICPLPADYDDWEEICNYQDRYWRKWSNVEIAHKFPRAGYPHLTFDPNNWEFICAKCNRHDGVIFSEQVIIKGKRISNNILRKLR